MSLQPPSPLGDTWLPTHVQVTVLRARGLRLKGKHETSDAFTIIQLGRERYSTTVAEKSTGQAEWAEECTFELPPGLGVGPSGAPPVPDLLLTVMHRALIGLDKFLGQVSLPLGKLLQEGRSSTDQWYKLQSKPGIKEKERGEIQVSVKFTRNNMTASMFDLSIKDKPRTPFGKLKDKIKGKKKYEMESASAIVSSSVGRLDSDEDDFPREMNEQKQKSKGFFLKGKLRKSSLTSSNTSIRSNNSVSSAGGANNADLGILDPELTKKPAHRNSSTDGYGISASPRQTHKRAFSDEVGQLSSSTVPELKAVNDQKPKNSPVSKSSLCVNGSHVYTEELPPKISTHVIEPFIMSRSLQNIGKKPEDYAHVVPSSHSEQTKVASSGPEEVGELKGFPASTALEDSLVSNKTISLNQPSSKGPRPEVKPMQIATPIIFSVELKKEKRHEENKKEEKKPKVSLFHHGSGRSENGTKTFVDKIVPMQNTNSPHISSNTDDRSNIGGWFGSKDHKDASQKPSFPYVPNATGGADEGLSSVEKSKPSSTTARPMEHIEDLSDIDQAARPTSDYSTVHVATENPLELPLPWSDPFDAFATSRLLPESNEERLSTPVNTLCKVNMRELSNSDCAVTRIQTSTTVTLKSGFPQINRVVVKMNELPSPTNLPSIQGSLFSGSENYKTKTLLPNASNDQPLMTIDNMVAFVPASYCDSSKKSFISARVKTLEKPDVLLQSNLNINSEENTDSPLTGLEMHPVQHESNLPARSLLEGNNSIKKLVVSQPDRQRMLDECPDKLSDCKFPNLGELKNINSLPVLSKSAEQSFPSIQTNVCFDSGSENKIAAVLPLVSEDLNVERHQNIAHQLIKDHSKPIDDFSNNNLSILIADNENVSMAQINELCTQEKVFFSNTNYAENEIPVSSPETNAHIDSRDLPRDQGFGLQTMEVLVSPLKPPRCFTPTIFEENKIEVGKQASILHKRDRKRAESPTEEMQEQNITAKNEKFPIVCPCPPVSDISGIHAEHLVMIDVDSDWSFNASKKVQEPIVRETSNGKNIPNSDEATEPEQFKTCLLKYPPNKSDQLSVKGKSNELIDLCSSAVQHQFVQLNDKPGVVQSRHASTETLAKENKPPILEIPETIDRDQTGHSGLFWSAYEYLPAKNEISTKYSTAVEQTCLEATVNEDVNKAIKQDTKPQIPNVISINSTGPSEDCTIGSNQPNLTPQLKSGDTLSLQSNWSADMIVDFKNVDFWKAETVLGGSNTLPSANPFVPHSPKNPFVETLDAVSNNAEDSVHGSPCSRKFKRKPPDLPPLNLHHEQSSSLHDSQPLAFSTPFLMASANTEQLCFPSPIISPAAVVSPAVTIQAAALSSCYTPAHSGGKSSSLAVLPQETQPAERLYLLPKSSPHPVKPISTSVTESAERKQLKSSLTTAFNNGLEKLRTSTTNSVQAVAPSPSGKPDLDRLKDPAFADQAAKYYHLTHDELIQMLLLRENELSKKDEHVQALESYLDQLLVRIMDHAPTLLQVPLEQKKK